MATLFYVAFAILKIVLALLEKMEANRKACITAQKNARSLFCRPLTAQACSGMLLIFRTKATVATLNNASGSQ